MCVGGGGGSSGGGVCVWVYVCMGVVIVLFGAWGE